MPGKAAKIIITEKQQAILLRLSRSRTEGVSLVQRSQIILLAFDGHNNESIETEVGLYHDAVGRWRRRWRDSWEKLIDIECREELHVLAREIKTLLSDRPRSGRKPRIGTQQQAAIFKTACESPKKRNARSHVGAEANPSCASCHQSIDPYGYAFENFDPMGGWREMYPAQASGAEPRKQELNDLRKTNKERRANGLAPLGMNSSSVPIKVDAIRSKDFKLIQNLMPERPWRQFNRYKVGSYPMLAVMNVMNIKGELTPEQSAFFAPTKPELELFDLRSDPHEVKNLAGTPKHTAIQAEMLAELEAWRKDVIQDRGVSEAFSAAHTYSGAHLKKLPGQFLSRKRRGRRKTKRRRPQKIETFVCESMAPGFSGKRLPCPHSCR